MIYYPVLDNKIKVEGVGMVNDTKIKHLEIVQAIINRMASNSFMLKGWAVTLVVGIFALAAKDSSQIFFLIAYVPIVMFWFLDSYYLRLERQYRALYDKIRNNLSNEIDFMLSPPPINVNDKTALYQCLLSPTELGFYLPFALLISIVVGISCAMN
jgi:hypothetical protein